MNKQFKIAVLAMANLSNIHEHSCWSVFTKIVSDLKISQNAEYEQKLGWYQGLKIKLTLHKKWSFR